MTRSSRLLACALVLTIAVACDRADSPMTPGGTGPMIREIQPSVILAGTQTQTITVNGDNFATGLTMAVTRPDNTSVTLGTSQIEGLTSSSFRTAMIFDQLGTYAFTVRSASGTNSPSFTLGVQATTSVPRLNSVAPASTPLSTVPQLLLFNGESLAAPLTVTMTDPDGFVTILGAEAIGNITTTSFQVTFVPSKRGAWSFTVTVASGAQSNSVVVSVG